MSKKASTEKTYAVELFIKMPDYKGKTFKGVVFAYTKDDAIVIATEKICEALVSQKYPCRHADVKVKSCVEFSDFMLSGSRSATRIEEAKDE